MSDKIKPLSCNWAVNSVLFASVLAFLLIISTPVVAAPSVKFTEADLVAPGSYSSGMTHTISVPGYTTPEEVIALARSLGADRIGTDANFSSNDYIQNIFEYVYSNIEVEFRYGLSKGAKGAIIDQFGTPFDQANLMVELIRLGGVTADYELGVITLTEEEFGKWTGLVNNLNETSGAFDVSKVAACRFLADGGIPAKFNNTHSASCAYAGNLSGANAVTLNHIWVSAGGNEYDPSFKPKNLWSGIDLSAAMGCGTDASSTCGSQVVAAFGTTGGGGVPSKNNVPETSIINKLENFAENFATETETNHFGDSLEEVLGGGEIDNALPAATSSLPYATGVTSWSGNIPDQFRTSVRIQFTTKIDETYFLDEVYGERLRLFPSANEEKLQSNGITGRPSLRLGPNEIAGGDNNQVSYAAASNKILTLSLAYPYPAAGGSYMDETLTFTPRVVDPDSSNAGNPVYKFNPIAILLGAGKAGAQYEARIADELGTENLMRVPASAVVPSHACTFSCPIGLLYGHGKDLPLVLAKWTSENSRLMKLQEAVARVKIQHHGTVGFIEEVRLQGGGFSPITAVSRLSVNRHDANVNKARGASITLAGAMNALEGGAARRQYNTPHATSAVSLMKLANWTQPAHALSCIRNAPLTYIHITNANLSSALSQLQSYNSGCGTGYLADRKTYIQNLVNAGFNVIATKEGKVGRMWDPFFIGWNVIPVYAYKPDGSEVSLLYMNSAGDFYVRKGGGTGMEENVDPLEEALANQEALENPEATLPSYSVSLSNGALQLAPPPDITTGNGGFPYSLSFQRSYDSTRRTGGYGQHVMTNSFTLGQTNINVTDIYQNNMLGWTHNYNNNAAAVSDAHQGLGADSVRDAASVIAVLKTANLLNEGGNPTFSEALASMFVLNWMDDQLYDNAVVVTGGASQGTYVKSPDGSSFFPPNGVHATLMQNGAKDAYDFQKYQWDYRNIDYTLTTREGQTLTFDERQGYGISTPGVRLTSWDFPEGVTVTYTWDGASIWKVENNLGRSLDFEYVKTGGGQGTGNTPSIRKIIDDSSRDVSYSYATLIPTKSTHESCCGAEPTSEISHHDTLIVLTSFIDAEGNKIKYNYSNFTESEHERFDIFLSEIYKAGNHDNPLVTIEYDEMGRVQKSINILGNEVDYYPGGLSTESARRGSIVNALGDEAIAFFNEEGLPYRSIDPVGNESTSDYDGLGRITRSVSPDGNAVEYKYDDHHNQTEVKAIAAPGSGLADIITKASFNHTATNDLNWADDALGNRTNFFYENGSTGLLTKVRGPAVYDAASGTNVRPDTAFTFDSRGLLLTRQEPDGVKTCFTFDTGNNYVLKEAKASCQSSGLNLKTNLIANARGDITTINGPRTDVTDTTNIQYDERRRPIIVTGADPDGSGPLPAPVNVNVYDADGLLAASCALTGDAPLPADPVASCADAAGISAPSGGGGSSGGGSSPSAYSINGSPSVQEGGVLIFSVTRSNSTAGAQTVNYTLAGSAISGTDYLTPSGTINFADGASAGSVVITTLTDSITENTETVIVTLTSASNGGTINMASATGTIANAPPPPGDDDCPPNDPYCVPN